MKIADFVLFVGGAVLGNEKGREWCLKNLKKASIVIDEKIKELPLAKSLGAIKSNGTVQSDGGYIRDTDINPNSQTSQQSKDFQRNAEGFPRNTGSVGGANSEVTK